MSATLLKSMNDRRLTIWERSKAILDAAEAEGRELTGDEAKHFEEASEEMTLLAQRAAAIVEAERINKQAEETLTRALGTGGGNRPADQEDVTDAGLRAFLRGETRHFDAAVTRGSARRVMEARRLGMSVEARDLSKLSAGAGGNLVPTNMYDQILQHLVDASGVMQAGPTIIQTAGGETFDVPVTTTHGAAVLTAEAAAIAESDPAFAKRSLGAYKYAQLVQVSRELIDDEIFDIVSYVADAAGRNCGLAMGTDLAVGNAASKPSGIVQTASTGVTGGAGAAGAFTADNLIDLQVSVIGPYRNSPSAAWLVRDSTLGAIRKLKDTAGQYLFSPAATVGAPDILLGKPIYTDPNIAAVALSAKSVVFGDISRYFVRLAGGVRFERSDEYAFNQDLVTFKAVVRGDGILSDQTGAVKVFVGNAA